MSARGTGFRGRGRGRGVSTPRPPPSPAPSTPISTQAAGPFGASSPAVSLFGFSQSDPHTTSSTGPFGNDGGGPKGQVVGFLASHNDDTDLTIQLDGHKWNVHSNLMSARSPFFEAICNGQWKESVDHTIKLHDDNPRIFARLLQFIYCDDYEGNLISPSNPDARIHLTVKKLLGTRKVSMAPRVSLEDLDDICNERMVHFELYELADKYGCQDLQNLARSNIGRYCGPQEIDNLRAMICHRSLSDWREVINKDDKLKEMFAEKLAANYKTLKAFVATEQHTEENRNQSECSPISLKEWLRWMEEDAVFCMMVVDAMSRKF